MAQMIKHTIEDFHELLKAHHLLVESNCYDRNDVEVLHLTFDSREVCSQTCFICKGATFQKSYLEGAVANGCVLYISETAYDLEQNIPFLIVSDIRKAMSLLANWFFGYAWEDLHVTAVGGTKGKSTTVYYIRSILDHYFTANEKPKSGIISSIEIYDGVYDGSSHNTTPEAVELQKHLRNAVDSHLSYVEMEVSSQGLKYGRLDGIHYDVGIFLNISEDHISPVEHPDFEDYFQSKLKMFAHTDVAIVNLDTDEIERVLEAAKVCKKIITISTKNPSADYYAYDIHKDNGHTVFRVKCADFDEEFRLSMPGLFNAVNALAAIAATQVYDVPVSYAISALTTAKVKGRMEHYVSKDGNVIAVVDFAHNQLSLETLLSSTREEYPDYQIVPVFGCPGGKAYNRRKNLGTVAGKLSDYIVLTADDPGNERVEDICESIRQYIGNCPYEIVLDRVKAIQKTIVTAKQKRIVLIVGKGPEETIRIGNEDLPYETDAAIAIRALEEYNESHI